MDWYNILTVVGIAVMVSSVVSLWLSVGAVDMAKDNTREMVAQAHKRIDKLDQRAIPPHINGFSARIGHAHRRITTIRDGAANEIKDLRIRIGRLEDANTSSPLSSEPNRIEEAHHQIYTLSYNFRREIEILKEQCITNDIKIAALGKYLKKKSDKKKGKNK